MYVWVCETVEDHAAGYIIGVWADLDEAVVAVKESHNCRIAGAWNLSHHCADSATLDHDCRRRYVYVDCEWNFERHQVLRLEEISA